MILPACPIVLCHNLLFRQGNWMSNISAMKLFLFSVLFLTYWRSLKTREKILSSQYCEIPLRSCLPRMTLNLMGFAHPLPMSFVGMGWTPRMSGSGAYLEHWIGSWAIYAPGGSAINLWCQLRPAHLPPRIVPLCFWCLFLQNLYSCPKHSQSHTTSLLQ